MKRFVIAFLLFTILIPTTSNAYWGLRRIQNQLPDSVYSGENGFNADLFAFAVSWARSEGQDDEWNWNIVDQALDFAEQHRGHLVLLLYPESPWATDGEPRAPDDTDWDTPLSDDVPERGYSESLYDYAYSVVDHCINRNRLILRYLRFGPEPQYNWQQSPETLERDVEGYIRSLRTVYIAAHDAADDHERRIYVSHGGFYYVTQLEREWWNLGEENEGLQDSILALVQSRQERHAWRIDSWEAFQRKIESRTTGPQLYWVDAMAGQTDWLDWFDVHYHFKPRFLEPECRAFEHVVADSGGEVKPWLAAEAAMQLAEGSLTDYDETFHAEDMARKWITGMAFGLQGICTPLIGYPPEHFFGLYNQRLQEYQSKQAYITLNNMSFRAYDDLSTNLVRHYRAPELVNGGPSSCHDVIWCDVLSDSLTDTVMYRVPLPTWFGRSFQEWDGIIEVTIFGDTLREIDYELNWDIDTLDAITITQVPIVLVWYQDGRSVDEDNLIIPGSFSINNIYPNPFNSQLRVDYTVNRADDYKLAMYSLDGRRIDELENRRIEPGNYTAQFNADGLPAGIYLLSLSGGGDVISRKVVLLK